MGNEVKISAAMGSLLLLGNYNVGISQKISILEAAATKYTNLSPRSSMEYFMKLL